MKKILKKLLVICGPTSTGKTSLAINLAKKFNGELISADSRQVFQLMDIGTGKDIPRSSEITYDSEDEFGYHLINGIKVWGYDLVDPKETFSVSQYIKIARRIINKVIDSGSLPILVGGTGLYIKGVVDGIATASVPISKSLRQKLETKSVDELFEMLSLIDSIKSASLNSSDKKNPRRLIRAIEVATWNIDHLDKSTPTLTEESFDTLFIGLNLSKDLIFERINQRVDDRLKNGAKNEIKMLLKNGVSWEDQSMSSLGYGLWRDYFDGIKTETEIIEMWRQEERNYAKRQITWFKKDKRINWFDLSLGQNRSKVEKLVGKWYKSK